MNKLFTNFRLEIVEGIDGTKCINKYTQEVPAGVRYLSDWTDFSFKRYFFDDKDVNCERQTQGCIIINKQIPGCGLTEYCLGGPEFVVLCSPRKLLLQNKKDQHGENVYLVVNEMDKDIEVDDDISKDKLKPKQSTQLTEQQKLDLEQRRAHIYTKIYNEILAYINTRRMQGLPPKILVTYDSYHIVMDILVRLGLFQKFYTVVDEFQSILHDARFKSGTELNFVERLKKSLRVIFVSATPMLDRYLTGLKMFDGVNYYELDWGAQDPTRVIRPDLEVSCMTSINSKAKEIIDSYLQGNFASVLVREDDGTLNNIVSDEAVFYVNSVNHILNIVKNNGLTPDKVNILCADNDENNKKISKRLGKGYQRGSIPLRGEKPKMFTFCTRTVYLGADFYSTCARTFIFSDSNSDCLSVDISEDLPQILGRQRLTANPWKNSANFYYKTTADYKKMNKESFDNIVAEKSQRTEQKLEIAMDLKKQGQEGKYNTLMKDYYDLIRTRNYRLDYVAVNYVEEWDSVNMCTKKVMTPVENDLVKINEIRAFDIQQIDYKDRFAVFSAIQNNQMSLPAEATEALEFMKEYDTLPRISDKLKMLCREDLDPEVLRIILSQIPNCDVVKSYFMALGPVRLRQLGCNISYIKKELGIVTFTPELLVNSIYGEFKVGEKALLSRIKERLANLYDSISYQATPRAKDLENYFKVRLIYIYVDDGSGNKKKSKGYELLESYEQEYRDKMMK